VLRAESDKAFYKMKFIDYNSPEKAIINTTFNLLPYIDMWISSIIEGYIYVKIVKINYARYIEEYIVRYEKKEGECKYWYESGQLWCQGYYKEGKREGEHKDWWPTGELWRQCYYKEGKLKGEYKVLGRNGKICAQGYYKDDKEEGEYKEWYRCGADGQSNGQLRIQCYYKEGKKDGEYKRWSAEGILKEHSLYKNGKLITVFLYISTK